MQCAALNNMPFNARPG